MLKIEDCKDIKVLYVEDDLSAAKSMMNIFRKFFPNIIHAKDGFEGLEFIKNNDLDLIVTDINMPKLNGIEMIRKIKDDLNKNIYTIMLTAYSDNDTFLESVKLGVKGYAIKPIVVMEFLETIESAVEVINSIKQSKMQDHYKHIMVSKTDLNGNIFYVNDKFCEVSCFTRDDLLGKKHNLMKYSDMDTDIYTELWNTISKRNIWVGQLKNIKKDGTLYRVDTTICPIVDSNGKIIEYIGLQNDITHVTSPLTQMQDLLYTSKKPFLAILRIENYETLEHIYSKDILAQMLEMFSMMLYTYLPDNLLVEQIINFNNGDFGLFKEQSDIIDANKIENILKELQYNITQGIVVVNDFDFDLSVVISFSTEKNKIYENVSYGLNQLSKNNKHIICANRLTDIVKETAIKNTKVIKMIQTAINNKKIVSYFQPITNNKTNKIEKYESLVRLIDENDKVLSPFFFLDIAKESGYYSKITNIVLENSFEALLQTSKEISINLSALDIEDPHIRSKIINLLSQHKEHTNRVIFELLEDEQVKDFQVVKDFITKAKSYGVQIAIDDFGAGVSNFERLLDYQPDILKIDACLIKNIDKDKYSKDVVETIQLFAWKQDIKTVGEFVETPEILKTIKDIGINYTQGYLLGKPDTLENHLKRENNKGAI